MSQRSFNKKHWVARLGAALEQVGAEASPTGFAVSETGLPNPGPSDLYRKEIRRQYQDLARRAKRDKVAAQLFDHSSLRLKTSPTGTISILREHPVLRRVLSDPSVDVFHAKFPRNEGHYSLDRLVPDLARSAVKLGGRRVATLLHHYLHAGECMRLRAHEITLIHGLEVKDPIKLFGGAYLASHEYVGRHFGLPSSPEAWLTWIGQNPGQPNRSTAVSALVRPFTWGPGIVPCTCDTGEMPHPTLKHRFPAEYTLDSRDRFFGDRHRLVDLLSVVTQSRLVTHTVFHALPSWMRDLNSNFRTPPPASSANRFEVWPKDKCLSQAEADDFAALARGWGAYPTQQRRAIELAARRIASSFGPAAGAFGLENQIFDVAIALEIMYGPFDGGEILHKLRMRTAWLLGTSPTDRLKISRQVKSFYKARSKVVHGSTTTDQTELAEALPGGQGIARQTLITLLSHGQVRDWDQLVVAGSTVS